MCDESLIGEKRKFPIENVPRGYIDDNSFFIEGKELNSFSPADFVWNVWCHITRRYDFNESPKEVIDRLKNVIEEKCSSLSESELYLVVEQAAHMTPIDEKDVERLLKTFEDPSYRKRAEQEIQDIHSEVIIQSH